MAKAAKTSEKPRKLRGAIDGVPFSKDNQPSSEAKKIGWQELRKRRYLSQAIIKEMLGDNGTPTDTFKGYLKSLIDNAKLGNAKAIEAVNKFIEDDIARVDITSGDKPITLSTVQWGDKEIKY